MNTSVITSDAETKSFDGIAFKQRMEELKEKILAKHPQMPILLGEIHKALRNNPEQVTLLSEEEMHVIVEGLEVQTKTALISGAVSGKGAKSVASKVKTMGIGAFGG